MISSFCYILVISLFHIIKEVSYPVLDHLLERTHRKTFSFLSTVFVLQRFFQRWKHSYNYSVNPWIFKSAFIMVSSDSVNFLINYFIQYLLRKIIMIPTNVLSLICKFTEFETILVLKNKCIRETYLLKVFKSVVKMQNLSRGIFSRLG